jgi:HlyD family secretion protein
VTKPGLSAFSILVVEKVSANAVNEPQQGLVFPVQVRLRQRTIKVHDKEVPLTPRMAVSAEIVIRQKSIMTFLLDPIVANWDKAFSVR